MNNRRRPTQTSFTIWAENNFWELLNSGLTTQRRLNKSQFIRDAIAEKMNRDFGIEVPDALIVPLPPHTEAKPISIKSIKKGKLSNKQVYSRGEEKQLRAAEEKASYASKNKKAQAKKAKAKRK